MSGLTGLFVGAGASYEVGMPLVWELTAELLNWLTPVKLRELNEAWRPQGGRRSEAVIDDFASVLVRRDMHYESILGYLEAQFKRHGPLARQHEYHALYSWLVEMVYHLLYFRHVNNAAAIERRLPLLDGVAHLAADNAPLWVFSLNHDLIMECVAARHSIPLNCGLSGEVVTLPRRDLLGVKKGELRAQVLREDGLEKTGMPFLQQGSPGINLLKIHGALDVFTFRDGKDLLKLLPIEQTVAGVLATLRAANEDLLCPDPGAPDGKVRAMNEIAYTDDDGEMQFLRRSLLAGAYKFDPHRDQVLPKRLLDYFRQHINHVSSLACIGYGFGDIHVNQVLRDWLGFAAERRLEIVCPGISAIPSFLQHLAPQVVLTDSCATDYLDRSAGIVRTRAETVQRKFDTWARGRKREHVEREMASFLRQRRQRLFKALAARAEELPTTLDGDLDTEALGESPQQLARQLVRDAGGTAEDLLDEFMSSQDAEQSLPATMPTHNEIAIAAYFRWLHRGSGHGQDREDWLVAEASLRPRE